MIVQSNIRSFFRSRGRLIALFAGILIFLAIYFFWKPEGLSEEGRKSIAIFALCSIYWVFDVLPLMITGLLAILLFPLLGVLSSQETFSLFGNQAVFFILGAFILSSGLIRSGLSQRIALLFLKSFGRTPVRLVIATLLICAFSSFFITEHAVAAMFFPIIAEICASLRLEPGVSRMGKALFISLAWGCVIGGIATYLGGARGPLALAILSQTTGEEVSFLKYSLCALPAVIFGLIFAGFAILFFFSPEIDSVEPATQLLREKISERGKITRKEISIGIFMAVVVLCWIFLGHKVGLAIIALAGVVLAFAFGFLEWKQVEEDVNWGVFLLYGGAISLGLAMSKTGAMEWLAGRALNLIGDHKLLIAILLSALSLFLTELISNSAVVALLMPVALGISSRVGLDPKTIMLLITIPSGLAFILPIGTPANAIAFSSGYYKVRDTLRAGFFVNLTTLAVFLLFAWLTWRWLGVGF